MSVTPVDFDLATTSHEAYLAARVRAVELSPGLATSLVSELRAKLVDARLVKLLLELELAHSLTDAEIFEVMKRFTPLMSSIRIAFVNRDARHHPSMEFGVQVSREFGEDYHYFTNTAEATAWLTSP